jgi:hypothetical protein
MIGPCGKDILQGFALRDFLASMPAESVLLDTRFRISPHVRLKQELRPGETGWRYESMQIELTKGMPYKGSIDPYAAALLGRCDGTQPLGRLLNEMQEEIPGINGADQAGVIVQVIRALIERGFLLPESLWDFGVPSP